MKKVPSHSAYTVNSAPQWDTELIRRYDLSGPRYTSYPTAPQFSASFTAAELHSAIECSNSSARPLSLYLHIPFCDTVCYYCGCNKIITANKSHAAPYLERLHLELSRRAEHIDQGRVVKQLHLGGGTPTFISHAEMSALMAQIRRHYTLLDDSQGEYSIEIHPGGMTAADITHLRKLGFNRLSMGIQDFNPVVQKAVNRFNSFAEVQCLMTAARAERFHSISMDLIYGLPLQTFDTMKDTLQQVIELSPDRLSLFNYAHMPHLFKVQKQIDASTLPEPQEKLAMLHMAIETLSEAGYVYIGMDHFAKPSDELAIAQREGVLQRNFQGYATCGGCDLLAFGVSSISAIDNIFVQNHKKIDDYQTAIDQQKEPIARGFVLSRDDQLRQAIINQLICHFELDFNRIETTFDIDFANYFCEEIQQLTSMASDGLLDLNPTGISVLPQGRLLIRRICMVFDAYLGQAQNAATKAPTPSYSRII